MMLMDGQKHNNRTKITFRKTLNILTSSALIIISFIAVLLFLLSLLTWLAPMTEFQPYFSF